MEHSQEHMYMMMRWANTIKNLRNYQTVLCTNKDEMWKDAISYYDSFIHTYTFSLANTIHEQSLLMERLIDSQDEVEEIMEFVCKRIIDGKFELYYHDTFIAIALKSTIICQKMRECMETFHINKVVSGIMWSKQNYNFFHGRIIYSYIKNYNGIVLLLVLDEQKKTIMKLKATKENPTQLRIEDKEYVVQFSPIDFGLRFEDKEHVFDIQHGDEGSLNFINNGNKNDIQSFIILMC